MAAFIKAPISEEVSDWEFSEYSGRGRSLCHDIDG